GRGLWRRQRRGVRYRGRDARRGAHAARLCRPAKRPAWPRHRLPDRWDDVARLLLVRADGRPMTEIALGSLFLTLLVLVLTGALILARNRLVPHEAVTVTINRNTRIEASRGDQLLSVLHAAGMAIPAACGGSGTCGLCRVIVEGRGVGDVQATELGVLSAADRHNHVRLACQT